MIFFVTWPYKTHARYSFTLVKYQHTLCFQLKVKKITFVYLCHIFTEEFASLYKEPFQKQILVFFWSWPHLISEAETLQSCLSYSWVTWVFPTSKYFKVIFPPIKVWVGVIFSFLQYNIYVIPMPSYNQRTLQLNSFSYCNGIC